MQEASAQTSLAQPAPAVPAAPMPAAPATPPPAHIELPDFTDEDIAEIEQLEHPAASLPALPEITVAPPKVKLVSEEPVVPAPANAVALPPDEILLPLGEEVKVERLEAAKFVSSQSYLMILGETRNIRKSLRQGDELIKDATLRHEQLDLQYKRAAADINSIQEHFIKIDSALFED